jgi:hypothetical protein
LPSAWPWIHRNAFGLATLLREPDVKLLQLKAAKALAGEEKEVANCRSFTGGNISE